MKIFNFIFIFSLVIFRLQGFASCDLAYSPDEKYAAMISRDGTIKICESKILGNQDSVLREPKDSDFKIVLNPLYSLTLSDSKQASAMNWSPDGNFFSAGSVEGIVDIWSTDNIEQFKLYKSLTASRELDSVSNLSWSVNGKFLAAILKDRIIKIWGVDFLASDLDQELFSFDMYGLLNNKDFQINSVDWSPCSNFLALNICLAVGAECKIESIILDVSKIYEKVDSMVTCSKC